jgi:hypothetical protein
MNTSIYDKTAKGREEIATRKYHLAPRLRTLLVLVDGHKPEEELLRNVAGLGLTVSAMQELLAQEFIVLTTTYAALVEPVPARHRCNSSRFMIFTIRPSRARWACAALPCS